MQIVINIKEDRYKLLKRVCGTDRYEPDEWEEAIINGTPLPKGHGNLKDIDEFIKRVEEDRMHECYMRSWTVDDVLQKLDSWYAPTIIEADKAESEVKA